MGTALSAALAGAGHVAVPAVRLSAVRARGRWGWGGAAGTAAVRQDQLGGETSLPNGRLAYLLGGHLWLVTPEGTERRLASGSGGWLQDPCWSPDGSQVAYAHVRFPVPTPGSTAIPWPSSEIYAAHADGAAEPVVIVRREGANDTLVSPRGARTDVRCM